MSGIKFSEMTKEQQMAKFEEYRSKRMEKATTGPAKRKAMALLKAAYPQEYDAFYKAELVKITGGTSSKKK